MLKSDIPIVFLDTETTGLHPKNKRVWDIGMIKRWPDNSPDKWYQFYVEVDLTNADPFSLQIGNFWGRHPVGRALSGVDSNEPPFTELGTLNDLSTGDYLTEQMAATVVSMVCHNAQIIGAVPDFDIRPLERMVRNNGGIWTGHYHTIDIENLALGFLLGWDARIGEELVSDIRLPFKSADLSVLLDVEEPSTVDRHTAIGDAAHVMRMWDRITRK